MALLSKARATGAATLEDVSRAMRRGTQQRVRRSLGIRGTAPTACSDPRFAYMPIDGAARLLHGDLSSMLVGGIASLLLQILHPQVMAGVAQHSRFREDPLGRLSRTARFVGTTTFGSTIEVRPAIERVRAIHATVRGQDDRGVSYRADDPHLLEWVHISELSMFVAGAQSFGPHRLNADTLDNYVREMASVASDLGVIDPPKSLTELHDRVREFRPELRLTGVGREARDFVLRGVSKHPHERLAYATLAAGAVSVLPPWAREQLEIPFLPLVDTFVARPATALLCGALRLFVPPATRPTSQSSVPHQPPQSVP